MSIDSSQPNIPDSFLPQSMKYPTLGHPSLAINNDNPFLAYNFKTDRTSL